jgi:hypothetical protein
MKLLDKDRQDRYQTAADLRADLRRLKREIEAHPASRVPVSSPAITPPSTPSASLSSDAQVVAAVLRRHRRGIVYGAVVIAGMVAILVYFVGRPLRQVTQGPPAGSLPDLQILQLTASSKASQPPISPDGNYVAYVQEDGSGSSLWIRQTASSSNVQIVSSQPGVDWWARP